MAMKIYVIVLWVLAPCSYLLGFQHFKGPCCLWCKISSSGLLGCDTV